MHCFWIPASHPASFISDLVHIQWVVWLTSDSQLLSSTGCYEPLLPGISKATDAFGKLSVQADMLSLEIYRD